MKGNRPWISLIFFCFAAVLAAALAFAAVVAGGSFALVRQPKSDASEARAQVPANPTGPKEANRATFSGLVTDSYCGARHRRYRNLAPTECAAACIRGGATYVLINGDHRYKLTGSREALAKHLGTRANVTGTLQGDTIFVDSAAPLF